MSEEEEDRTMSPYSEYYPELVGETVLGVMASKRSCADHIGFLTPNETVKVYEGEGDCCAHAYFHHMANVDACKGGTVSKVETRGHWDPLGEYGDTQDTWISNIYTDKGTMQVEMRIDHNGYYGGWPRYVGEVSLTDCCDRFNLSLVTEDW